MGMELLMARARLNHLAAAPAIVPVGSKATSQNAVSGSGVTSLTLACTLPAGCQAGDVVVLTCSAQQARSFAWVKPTGATSVLDSTLIGSAGVFAVYTYTLTSADVTAGTVGVPCTLLASSTVGTAVIVDAYRTVSDSNLDVVGALATGTLGASPASIPASGITTTKPGDLLQYSVCVGNAVVSMSASAPSGWTNGDAIFAANNAFAASGYMLQTSAGDTGTITPTISYGSAGTYPYGIILLALRVKQAAIDLSATFPSSTHVGDAVSFDVTATLVDGATGSLTITVDQLPAGLTLGATSMVDATHYKATVSGTLTTAQNITSTFGATGGSVAPAPLAHAFNVTVAPSLSVVQSVSADNSGTSLVVTLPTAPTAGNYLVAIVDYRNTSSRTPSLDGGTWTAWSVGASSRGNSAVNVFKRLVASGDSAMTTITFGSSDVQSAVIMEVAGSTGTVSSAAIVNTGPYPQALTIPAGVSGALPIAFNTWGSGAGTTYTPTAPSGWTAVNSIASGQNPMGVFARSALSSGAAISVTPNGSISTSLYPQCGGFLIS